MAEQEVLPEDLTVHNHKTKRASLSINNNHQYFEKRIIWDLIKANEIRFYLEADLEVFSKELFQLVYNDVKVFETLGNHIFIQKVLDKSNCFEFNYQPHSNDMIMLREVYRFNALKYFNRFERTIKQMIFSYENSCWKLFEQ